MSNFTPGPWIFDKANVGHTMHAGYALYTPDFETGHEFCYVLCSGDTERKLGKGAPEANANLIAAAPRMHGALVRAKAFLDLFEEISEQAFGDWAGLRREIVEVLAEAEVSK